MRCRIRRLSGSDAQACRIRRLSGPDAIDIYVDSEPQGTKGPQGTRNASNRMDGEQDGGGSKSIREQASEDALARFREHESHRFAMSPRPM